jgi:protein phosphatase
MPARVDLGACTHPGSVRTKNEDHYLVARIGRWLETLLTNLPEGQVPARSEVSAYGLVVADGMGGHAAGEVASMLAIRTLVNLILDTPDWILLPDDAGGREILRRTVERYRLINDELAEQARARPHLYGMGTTMTAAASVGVELLIAHVGDSRVYLLRQGMLARLTRDHTVAQALADSGQITQEEVASHRLRHILIRSLGIPGEQAQPEVQRLQLADGDCLLLCTDGLTDMVDEATITQALAAGQDAQAASRRLVDLALEAGGKDNVTVVVARYWFPPAPEAPPGDGAPPAG